MDSIEQKIVNCVNEKLNDGTVERLIEEKLEKGISDAIGELFSYGGSAKKMLVKKFEETMTPVIEEHDFNKHLIKLDAILTEVINKTAIADNEVVLDNFRRIMKKPVEDFSIVPISKIYEEYQNCVSENIDTSELEINYDDKPSYYDATTNMEVEMCEVKWFRTDTTEYLVKFTCDEDEQMNCEFRLRTYTNGDIHVDETTIPMDIHSLATLSGFEIFIQQLKRAWSKIDLDIMESHGDDVEIKAEPEASFS